MKKLIIIFFPLIVYPDTTYRKVNCQAFLNSVLQDKTTFYLYPSKSVTSRLSINKGEDEIFLTVDHNVFTDSMISVKDYHYGSKSSETKVQIKKDFKMADMEKTPVEIQIPTKNSLKTATIKCSANP